VLPAARAATERSRAARQFRRCWARMVRVKVRLRLRLRLRVRP
jgi:hypothetical protein